MTKRLAAYATQVDIPGTRFWRAEETGTAVGGDKHPAAIVVFDSHLDRDAWLSEPHRFEPMPPPDERLCRHCGSSVGSHFRRVKVQLEIERILAKYSHLDLADQLDLRADLGLLVVAVHEAL